MQHIEYELSNPKNAAQRIPGGRTSCRWNDGSKADGAKVKAEVPHRVDFFTLGAHQAEKITYMQEVVDEAVAEETNEHTQRKHINNKNNEHRGETTISAYTEFRDRRETTTKIRHRGNTTRITRGNRESKVE